MRGPLPLPPLRLGLALWGAALLASCVQPALKPPPRALPEPRTATLFVTSELKGYLGPCGCSLAMRGGVARAAHQVLEARKQDHPVYLVDTGDALFGTAQVPPDAVPQQERKAKALAQALTLMGLDVQAVGPLDDARGSAFRASLGLPALPASGFRLVGEGDRVFGVVAGDTLDQLQARAAAATAAGARLVVALWRRSLDAVLPQLDALQGRGVALVVATRAKDELSGEQNKLVRGAVPVAQVQTKGRSLLRVELGFGGPPDAPFELLRGAAEQERELRALDERIELLRTQANEPMLVPELRTLRQGKLDELMARRAALAATPVPAPAGKNSLLVRFVPLEEGFPQEPRAKAIEEAYDKDVGLLNLAWAREHGKDCPPPVRGEAAFVGNEACRDCHEEAFPVWDASKHAHGYQTLEERSKQYHLDCVGCHVTGWQQPGGVCRVDRTKDRQGIGCESCHGPGSLHAEDPSADNVQKGGGTATCTGCHDRENSPHFEYERFLQEVLGPGHGQPLPDAGTPAPPPPPPAKAAPKAKKPAKGKAP